MTDKVDFKTLDSYQARRGQFRVLDIPDLRYLAVDGHGDPNTSLVYTEALEALYPVAYTLKFASKRELGRDYVVPPLEGLWWADDVAVFTTARDKSKWRWTMLLMVPDWIEPALIETAIRTVGAASPPARLDDVRVQSLSEGRCVQTLHVGSFDDEGPVLLRMHEEFIPSQGLQLTGTHHEVYFSDARKVAPEKLRTLLRQPVTQGAAT